MDGADCATQGSATDSWTYTYDGDGVRVEEVYTDSTNTLIKYFFAGGDYEVQDDGTTTTTLKYYSIAGMRVAMDDGTDLVYFASDHLSSTSIVLSDTGTLLSEQGYKPFGEVRTDVGTILNPGDTGFTDFGYTGQRNLGDVGLMDYNARFYSPLLGRFIQPDTIIPNPGDSQAWNRYSYTSNNPIRFMDPTGHIPEGACGFQGGDCPRPKRVLYQGCSSETPEMCLVKNGGQNNGTGPRAPEAEPCTQCHDVSPSEPCTTCHDNPETQFIETKTGIELWWDYVIGPIENLITSLWHWDYYSKGWWRIAEEKSFWGATYRTGRSTLPTVWIESIIEAISQGKSDKVNHLELNLLQRVIRIVAVGAETAGTDSLSTIVGGLSASGGAIIAGPPGAVVGYFIGSNIGTGTGDYIWKEKINPDLFPFLGLGEFP